MIIELIIGGIILLLIVIIVLIILSCHNKFKLANIKINVAERNIDSILNKKKYYIDKIKPMIINEIDEKNFLEDLEELNINEVGYFESNKILADLYAELLTTIDENEKLLNNEEIENIIDKLSENEVELIASIKYYNDSSNKINEMIKTFPSNILRVFFRFKKKELFKDEKREIYKILKEK